MSPTTNQSSVTLAILARSFRQFCKVVCPRRQRHFNRAKYSIVFLLRSPSHPLVHAVSPLTGVACVVLQLHFLLRSTLHSLPGRLHWFSEIVGTSSTLSGTAHTVATDNDTAGILILFDGVVKQSTISYRHFLRLAKIKISTLIYTAKGFTGN